MLLRTLGIEHEKSFDTPRLILLFNSILLLNPFLSAKWHSNVKNAASILFVEPNRSIEKQIIKIQKISCHSSDSYRIFRNYVNPRCLSIRQAEELCNQGALAGQQNVLECTIIGCEICVIICATAFTGFCCGFTRDHGLHYWNLWCKELDYLFLL